MARVLLFPNTTDAQFHNLDRVRPRQFGGNGTCNVRGVRYQTTTDEELDSRRILSGLASSASPEGTASSLPI